MLLLSFFGHENLTGRLSLSTLIKALRTVMELLREKYGRSISLCERRLDLPVPPGRLELPAQSVRLLSLLPCNEQCQAHMVSGSISGCLKAPSEAQRRAQTHSRTANPFLTFTTASVFTTAGT
jgi:hypothetical protein